MDVIRREHLPLKTETEIESEQRKTDDFLAQMEEKTQKNETSSSDEEEKEETRAPESPGKWEIMPGSSATRPQESDLFPPLNLK